MLLPPSSLIISYSPKDAGIIALWRRLRVVNFVGSDFDTILTFVPTVRVTRCMNFIFVSLTARL